MENVKFIEVTDTLSSEVTEHAIIEHADGSFTSMLKSTYEAQQAQAALSTPIVSSDE